ncbi:MAG: protein translocase subunit SecD, partial [Methylocella sp.]
MLRFPTWKIVSILAMTALALLLIVPSLLTPGHREALISHLPRWMPARAIVLGLDLQGGSHVLLEVDSNSVVKSLVDNLRDSVRRVLREDKVAITGGIGAQPRGVQLRIPDPGERARVMPKLRQLAASAGSGLSSRSREAAFDVSENDSGLIQFTVTEAGVKGKVRRAVEQSIEVLRRRVDALGTTEPNIQRQGADRILVEVPG